MLIEYYLLIKHLHMSLVGLSISILVIRTGFNLGSINWRKRWPWLNVLPHIVDSLLLLSGITLATLIKQYPFVNGWISLKLLLLLVYIGLGSYVLKKAKTRKQMVAGLSLGLMVIFWMVMIARTKLVWPF